MDLSNRVYGAMKASFINLINPFTSTTKTASVATAFVAKFLLNFSFKYSCLIGLLTFGSLKIYQINKNQQSKSEAYLLELLKKRLQGTREFVKLNIQDMPIQVYYLLVNTKDNRIIEICPQTTPSEPKNEKTTDCKVKNSDCND